VLGKAWSFLKQTATPFMAGRAAASIAGFQSMGIV
jgi:hypothetical protein